MKERIGSFEQLVLLAVMRLSEGAYGMAVKREITERTGRPISLGAVYATLDRLENKGYITSSEGSGSPDRQGRARRFFRVQASGRIALEASLADVKRMVQGLKLQWDRR